MLHDVVINEFNVPWIFFFFAVVLLVYIGKIGKYIVL